MTHSHFTIVDVSTTERGGSRNCFPGGQAVMCFYNNLLGGVSPGCIKTPKTQLPKNVIFIMQFLKKTAFGAGMLDRSNCGTHSTNCMV